MKMIHTAMYHTQSAYRNQQTVLHYSVSMSCVTSTWRQPDTGRHMLKRCLQVV